MASVDGMSINKLEVLKKQKKMASGFKGNLLRCFCNCERIFDVVARAMLFNLLGV